MSDNTNTVEQPLKNNENKLDRLLYIAGVIGFLVFQVPDFANPSMFTLCIVAVIGAYLVISYALFWSPIKHKASFCPALTFFDLLILGLLASYPITGVPLLFQACFAAIHLLNTNRIVRPTLASLGFISGWILGAVPNQFSFDFISQPYTETLYSLVLVTVYAVYSIWKRINLLKQWQQKVVALEQESRHSKFKLYQAKKYLPPQVIGKLSDHKELQVRTKRKKLTLFFSDLVGFSELAEEMEPQDLNLVLNDYLSEMSRIAAQYGGQVNKFMGDGIMIVFGDPVTKGPKQDAIDCVDMALEMRRRMNMLINKWQEQGISKVLMLRMGINSGFSTVGSFGSNERLDYTALGTEVNLAARLETAADTGEILISSSTFLLTQEKFSCQSKGDIKVKGFQNPVAVYTVEDSRERLHKDTSYQHDLLNGFSLYMDLEQVPHYDRKHIMNSLQDAANKLKNFKK